MIVTKQSALAALLGICVVGPTYAQAPAPAASARDRNESSSAAASQGRYNAKTTSSEHTAANPAAFVKNAAQDGLTEVALGKQAATKAQDPKVRQFADHMVQDHSKANDELKNVAKKKGLEVPSSLDTEHQAIVQKMSGKSGADFDAAYSEQMIKDHGKAVALFEGATKSPDADLAAFAEKTLPTLKEHERMAQQLPGAMHSASASQSPRPKQ
jgi:putative membrane protein